ncbi:hypothetical protein J7J13_03360 [bacterium]|nr:hypothetical protein [bacterium]
MKLVSKIKKIRKYFKPKALIIIFIGLVALPAVIFATNTINEGYRVNSSSSVIINAHGTCKKVANSSESVPYFIPTKTSAEWTAFINASPSNSDISLSYNANDHKGCYNGDSYWYDTCGSRQGIAESCHGCGCVGAGVCSPYGVCCKHYTSWAYAGDCCNWFACMSCNLPTCRVGPNIYGPVCGVPSPWGGDKNNIWTRSCDLAGWCCL